MQRTDNAPAMTDRTVPQRGKVWLEPATLVAVGLVALAVLLFAGLADGVLEHHAGGFDERILLALRHPENPAEPIGPAWMEAMFLDLTSLGSGAVLTLVTVLVAGYLLIARRGGSAVFLVVSIAGGWLMSLLLKGEFERPRPEVVPHLVEATSYSFPSGHSMLSAVAYLTLGALLARFEPRRVVKAYVLGCAVTLTLLVGISRVYLGVHWPTDVLGGWAAGSAWALLCWLVADFLQRRRALAPASGPPEGTATEP